MSADYTNWLLENIPQYLKTKNGKMFLKGFTDTANELISQAEQAKKETMSQQCSTDTLPYHFQNTYTIDSPFETDIQKRAYLSKTFDGWRANGSPSHLLSELARFGIPNAKIWTWTDLMLAGVPKAFGGNYTNIGVGPDGVVKYLPNADLAGPGWKVSHLSNIVTSQIIITVDILNKTLIVNLEYDGVSIKSTARQIVEAIGNDSIAKRYFFALYSGNGSAIASTTIAPVLTNFAYYSYYFIDAYDPAPLISFVKWNEPGIFWNDGVSFWDGVSGITGANYMKILREVIRRASPASTSCRFIRVFDGATSYTIPIASQWEEDADGNMTDFYTTGY